MHQSQTGHQEGDLIKVRHNGTESRGRVTGYKPGPDGMQHLHYIPEGETAERPVHHDAVVEAE